MEYKKKFNQGFCTVIRNLGPSQEWYGDTIVLDFDFEFKTNICGFHVYLDDGCKICARKTLYRAGANASDNGIACLSQYDNGGWFRSMKAAPCDGTGVGCWNG